jgi:protein involved in polysaccharide export with SLBB domain
LVSGTQDWVLKFRRRTDPQTKQKLLSQKVSYTMTNKLLILFALIFLVSSGSFCAGQTDYSAAPAQTVTCPAGPGSVSQEQAVQCSPETTQAPVTGLNGYPARNGTTFTPRLAPGRTEGAQAPSTTPSTRVIGPITTRSEFEMFAEDAARRTLHVYGRQLFDEVPTTFAPTDRIPVPASYVIGPGDQLLIRAWGKIDLDTSVTVDRNGQIFLSKVGILSVAGLRYEQLESYLHTAVANLYKDFELNVTMGQLRSIQIFVLGSARQPGTYTVSSLSTLVNALFASGGPSATGSMRHIQLRRDNRILVDFDIYDLVRRGDKSRDMQLLAGDVIYIPPAGPQVAIIGSVNEPGIYELKGETTIAAALSDAGGLTNLAEVDRVLLEKIENHRRRGVDDFPLDAAGLERTLKDGDMLRIFPISPRFDNAVILRGNVSQPGHFPWHEGMRVTDLIPSRDFLITRSYWYQEGHLTESAPVGSSWSEENGVRCNQRGAGIPNGAYGTSGNRRDQGFPDQENGTEGGPREAETPNQEYDAAGNARDACATDPGYGTGGNAPVGSDPNQQNRAPVRVPIDIMTDLVQNTAEINWDYASIQRLDEQDLSTRLVPFNLGNAIANPASADNQLLKPGDVITIFSRSDLPLPTDKHATFVRVSGEVNAPGVYRVEPGDTLRNVVERAGGLTPHSYLYASELRRVSTRQAEEDQLRVSIAQMQRELTSRYAAASSLTTTSAADQQTTLNSQQAAIAQLAAVTPTGRIVLDMQPNASTVADIPNFPLEDGDSFYIPPKLSTVQVAGAVYNENAFRYQPRKHLSAYLNDAGGPTRQADTRRIFLVRADGTVISRQSHGEFWHTDFESTVLLPGDAIIVPTKLKSPNNFMQQLPALAQTLSQTAMTGAVIGTTY